MTKQLLTAFLLLIAITFTSCGEVFDATELNKESGTENKTETASIETEEMTDQSVEYYIRTTEPPAEESLQTAVYTYDNYEEACAYVDDAAVAALGYAVYNADGDFLYGKYSKFVTEMLAKAKYITDFIRENRYTYGNAQYNPSVTYHKYLETGKLQEKVVSCDRLVGWVLYEMGYTDQPNDGGLYVWDNSSDHDLGTYLQNKGFSKITAINDIEAGDIVFVNPKSTSSGTKYPSHVFLCAGKLEKGGCYYRYDAGSQNRIRCANEAGNGPDYTAYSESGQPFKEPITNLVYAYRYVPAD